MPARCKSSVNPRKPEYNCGVETGAEWATRLLIVDDDEKLCRLLREYLEPLGYSIDPLPPGATFDLKRHSFEWTPTADQIEAMVRKIVDIRL